MDKITPTLSCFGSFAMRAIFWEISVKFCTIFRRFRQKIDSFQPAVLDMSKSVQIFGDFGEKLTAFNLYGAVVDMSMSVQIFGDFGEKLSVPN